MSRFRNVGDTGEIDKRNRVPPSLSLCQWSVVEHRRVGPSQGSQLLYPYSQGHMYVVFGGPK